MMKRRPGWRLVSLIRGRRDQCLPKAAQWVAGYIARQGIGVSAESLQALLAGSGERDT